MNILRTTPVKNEIYKTDIYLKHKKLIYKLANKSVYYIELDLDDLISEFNIVFCKCIKTYIPSKGCFSTYLYKCCKSHICNLIRIQNEPKRNKSEKIDLPINYFTDTINPEKKVILFDNFVNNKNPVIKSIMGILSTYKLPNTKFKIWLRDILNTYGFTHKEISKAFKTIKTLY